MARRISLKLLNNKYIIFQQPVICPIVKTEELWDNSFVLEEGASYNLMPDLTIKNNSGSIVYSVMK